MDYGVIDARVSTELQEKGYSLDGQVKAGLAYAEKHDIFVSVSLRATPVAVSGMCPDSSQP